MSKININVESTMPSSDHSALEKAAHLILNGDIVSIPTETVYGLAADATNGLAVAKIYAAKGRPKFNPLICHVDGLDMANTLAEFDVRADRLVAAFWPGSLTIVAPKKKKCPVSELATAGLDTIALRCPKNSFTRALISDLGKPLAAPSANPSGKLSPTKASDVRCAFSNAVLPLVVDGGPCSVGLESTIVSCIPGQPVTILRPGVVTHADISGVLGIEIVEQHQNNDEDEHKPVAPGMLSSHYAPDAGVELVVEPYPEVGANHAVLTFAGTSMPNDQDALARLDLSPNGSLAEAAANLFSMLRELDSKGPDIIYVVSPPQTGLGIAIYDRLQRAAAPRINVDTDQ